MHNDTLDAGKMAVLSYECLLLFKRTEVQLLAPKSGSIQQSVIPVSGDLMPSSGICRLTHVHEVFVLFCFNAYIRGGKGEENCVPCSCQRLAWPEK